MHPWQRSALKDAGPNETIALIGSGLSAIDILVESTKSGFSGTFHVIAPRAWFPCVHAEDLSPVPPLAKPPEWRSVRQALRELRLLSKSYAEWQHAIDAVRPHLNSIWCALPECERERFFRHGALLWDKHRHRMPRSAGAVIDSLKAAGRLRIESGHVVAVAAEASKVTLTVFNRSTANTSEIIADRAVNCTGFTLDVQQSPSPLTRSIMSTQLGFPGAHRFGWRTALSGALVTLSDEPITGMWAIGALRRGIEFESTAARELRVQAEELANKILRVSLDQSEPATAARSAFPP